MVTRYNQITMIVQNTSMNGRKIRSYLLRRSDHISDALLDLLYILWLQIFIRLSPTVTKLCHIKCDHQRAFRSMVDMMALLQFIDIVQCSHDVHTHVGTCKSAVCVRIESRIEPGVNIRIRIESSQLQQILNIKISNYK